MDIALGAQVVFYQCLCNNQYPGHESLDRPSEQAGARGEVQARWFGWPVSLNNLFPRREGSVYTVLADREVIVSAGALNTPQVGTNGLFQDY